MKEFNSKFDNKINQLSLGEISIIINRWINKLKNEINLLVYIESSVRVEKNNLSQNEIQAIVSELNKLKIESIDIKKQIENFSINYTNFNNYKNNKNNQLENDEIVKQTIRDLNEKYENICNKINSFIVNIPLLTKLKNKFFNGQIKSYSHKNNNKKINNSLPFGNNILKNSVSKGNINKGNKINFNSSNYVDNEKKRKIDILKDKIKNIKINFEQAQLETNDYPGVDYDKNFISPSNKYNKDLKYSSFIKNDTYSNISNDLTNASRDKILCVTKRQSLIKKENEKLITNSNFHIHNSCNNSSINLNIINHNHNNNHDNINNIGNINKIIPNNYRHKSKNQIIPKKLNTNPNTQDVNIKGTKSSKNNKTLNFPIKNILLSQKMQKKIKFKKLKPNIILKDKEKINIYYNNSPKSLGQNPNKINNLNTYNKILYSKPFKHNKRSYSEYYLKPIDRDLDLEKEYNSSPNNNENNLKGFSLDNLKINKFEIQNKNSNIIKKRRTIIRNRTFNIFNDNSGEAYKNISFTFGYKNLINNNITDFKKLQNNEKVIDYDYIMKSIEENKILKNEINSLKEEIKNIKNICQNLSLKVTSLEEQNEALKKENQTILNLLNMNQNKE